MFLGLLFDFASTDQKTCEDKIATLSGLLVQMCNVALRLTQIHIYRHIMWSWFAAPGLLYVSTIYKFHLELLESCHNPTKKNDHV